MNLQQEFEQLARKHIHRDGLNELLAWLASTDFYKAPASTRYHGAHEGGLVLHSLNVFKRLRDLNDFYADVMNYDTETMAVVSLFHDLCKVDYYKVSTRNAKNEVTGQWEKVPYYAYEEKFPFGGHGSKSMYLVMNFIRLSPVEAAAINCHMGAWDASPYGKPGDVFNDNLLAWELHVADEAATYIDKT